MFIVCTQEYSADCTVTFLAILSISITFNIAIQQPLSIVTNWHRTAKHHTMPAYRIFTGTYFAHSVTMGTGQM